MFENVSFMIKKGFLFTIMAAALTMVWGCGSSDDDDDIQPPVSQNETTWTKESQTFPTKIDWSGSDSKPGWADFAKLPDVGEFENWMILMVTLQDELAAYATEDDFMAVFVGGSLRALTNPAIKIGDTKDVTFILKVLGNEASDKSVEITLKYYCAQLHQTFTVVGSEKFLPERVYGVNETFYVPLMAGCPKFPVCTPVTIYFPQEEPSYVEPSIGDMFLLIVDDECRGVTKVDEHKFVAPYPFTAYAKRDGEEGRIYFYDVSENTFWNTGKTVVLTKESQVVYITY